MLTRSLVFGLLALFLTQPTWAEGQMKMEFGVDAAYERASVRNEALGNPTLSLFALPLQSVRVGFLMEGVSLEPRLGITRVSTDGDNSETQVRASLAGLFFPGGEESVFFLSLVTGMDYASVSLGSEDASTVQLRVGGGGGVRVPLRDRLAFRTSVEYHRSFESRDALAVDHLIAAFGVSLMVQ